MGYGLRNVGSIPGALGELQRVVAPGGKVAVLDFNNATNPLVDAVQVSGAMGRAYGGLGRLPLALPKAFVSSSKRIVLLRLKVHTAGLVLRCTS